jgi:hypothetical protein
MADDLSDHHNAKTTDTAVVALLDGLAEPISPGGRYDYDALGPEMAKAARDRVARMDGNIKRVQPVGQTIIEIGEDACWLKEGLPPGDWPIVVAAEWGKRHRATISRCMACYRRLKEFRNLRNLANKTTVYAVGARFTSDKLRRELNEAFGSGATHSDAYVMRRIAEDRAGAKRRSGGHQLERRDHARSAWTIVAEDLTPQRFADFRKHIDKAEGEFARLRNEPHVDLRFLAPEARVDARH